MSLAPQELENSASKYAAEAIRLDSEGSRGMAIQSYQRAIEALVKLVQVYPEYKLNRIYMERASTYQNRIKALQMTLDVTDGMSECKSDPAPGEAVNPPRQKRNSVHTRVQNIDEPSDIQNEANKDGETSKVDFDGLLLKEKPEVSWDEVVGLEDAKRAIRESIVYPTKR
nr:AAA family ATPase [Thermoproteota archaeon]